ncbi:nickel pincer cofactor biosynthesis protein LarB [Pediococcus acidilactici]|uniref:Nickel pincer cofactor biosynthesis protein LarB n=1 Tax=Pediococcus acidilactici TaxID=1254 RepID=A0AAW8YP79_PEDAC|nr:nickel pincer cofactor biosynthesis protein LarB [Pediococcus acidilactici]MDV2911965.1 nickel pincer cofactor biosynthesis protein LarB [Pediococcus acidilactici]WQS17484.1 nickel pincer cofactor biosynthesis protein LarB [Pediococcus acidilactici]
MNVSKILQAVKNEELSVESASQQLIGFSELGFAKVDTQRKKRNGYPEVIYGSGKTVDQIIAITEDLLKRDKTILTTRVSPEKAQVLKVKFPQGQYHEMGRCFVINPMSNLSESYIAVVTAGTSDLNVAEEAAITAETFGNRVERVYDVGVAGIHRLFANLDVIKNASVIIAIAGMEGALVSVVGGLVDKPVIAVPTSIGYGTNLAGITALFSMLNSCSSGVSVVNIDNGFGAAYNASMINRTREGKEF